ncbi:hypothetical protein N657DRAFT_688424 [Parathielavia appendiculata]|uniref:Uncharacterized protein n=1 Tax=Parathielavia appendiculata TaxID=2587402 RepID=A0AAN6Z589_9PEZI|nr:hypothetical protein N657DRAFT_688424 [Parathielavia appendiculata]
MGAPVPPRYQKGKTSEVGLLVAAFLFGASVAVAVYDSAKAGRQSYRSWHRRHRANAYIVMLWAVISMCMVAALCCWLYLLGKIQPSIHFFVLMLVTWVIQIQCLMQILANRLSLILYNPEKARRLKLGLFIAIGLINISVFVIWVPARLRISETWIRINVIWDRMEKAIFAVIDMGLNGYFMWLVKSKLVAGGLKQYNLVYRYNLVMSCLSVSLDVMLIGLMSLRDDAVYVQAHPLVCLTKLNIEMNMAELLGKVVKKSTEQRASVSLPLADVCQPQLGIDTFDRQWLGSAKNVIVPSGSRGSSRGSNSGGGGCGGGQMHELNMDILNESGRTQAEEVTRNDSGRRHVEEATGSTSKTPKGVNTVERRQWQAPTIRPRSSTKGPLDDDGPLASPLSADHAQQTLSLRSQPRSPSPRSLMKPRSPAHSPAPTGKRSFTPGIAPARHGPKDFSYLLRPEIYHDLTPLNNPPSFRNPPNQLSKDTPIPDLLSQGYFRAAAIAAAHRLTSGALDPTDHAQIFDLLYTRLACLTLLDATALAAQEVKALGDLHSAFYYSSSPAAQQLPEDTIITSAVSTTTTITAIATANPTHLVPWPLRVLAVRLQALGFSDPRRAVMSYYDLAREARVRLGEAKAAHDHSAMELWKERLADLGVRVAGALVEMDDLTGAVEHLETLRKEKEEGSVGAGMGRIRMALLYLHLGDVSAARGCVGAGDGVEDGVQERVVTALCDMADGDFEAALGKWAELKEKVDDEMVGVNMAVCLLYVGRMQEGRALLEQLVDSGRSSHTLLFNLTTMYELCTDRSRALKVKLSERVAARENRDDGWEKSNADFKL